MKKALSFMAVTVLFLVPLNAFAVVKAGSTCTKLGATSTYSGKKYTCIKSGKKLVWNIGVTISKPVPISTIAPSASPTASPAPTQQIIDDAPTGFADVIEKYKSIPATAWNFSHSKIEASKQTDLIINLILGPNTKLPNSEIPKMFKTGTQFFSGFPQPQKINAIYYVFDDITWAQDKIMELYMNSNFKSQIPSNCVQKTLCNGANAFLPIPDTGNANFAVLEIGNNDDYHLKGGIEIHEYAHTVQFRQFQGKPTEKLSLQLLPQWFVEGHAHVAGNLASASTLSDYKNFRKAWRRHQPIGMSGFDADSIEAFYAKLGPGKSDGTVFQNVYSVGYFTLEVLVSLKGVDSPMQLIEDVASGDTFEQAFKKVYGISWNDASPILAKTVSRILLEP